MFLMKSKYAFFFYLFYFLILFHSYLSLPIGARVIFWNSPSKLGSVQ